MEIIDFISELKIHKIIKNWYLNIFCLDIIFLKELLLLFKKERNFYFLRMEIFPLAAILKSIKSQSLAKPKFGIRKLINFLI